jgi:hypothetical protein
MPSALPTRPNVLTPADHGLILHDGGHGFVTIAQRVRGSWCERGIPIADLGYFLRQLDPALDSYISQNRFYLPCRRIAYLVQADALFSDLDYYGTAFGRHHPRSILDFALKLLDDANIPAPTFATATGRGLAVVWLHTPIPRRALPRWKACQDRIFRVLKSLGADPNARDAARVLRLVGTRNSRSGTLVETISGVGDIWDFDTLAREILPDSRDEIRDRRSKRERARSRVFRTPVGFNKATLWASRLDDFQKLIFHRHGGLRLPSGGRDILMLLWGVGMSYLVHSPERLRREMFTLANDICGWSEPETRSRLSTVFLRADAAFRGERIEYLGGHCDPRYRYRDSTLVEMLDVSEHEMRVLDLRHLVTDEIKRDRDRHRKIAERRSAGAIPRDIYLAESLSQSRPWERDAVSRRTWERRRLQNIQSTTARVASPSGCMVAEPGSLGDLQGFGPAAALELISCEPAALPAMMQRKPRQLELPLEILPLPLNRAALDGWRGGIAPLIVRSAIVREIHNRDVRHQDLANAVGLSRPQITNLLRGRFGTAPEKAERLKCILDLWMRAV